MVYMTQETNRSKIGDQKTVDIDGLYITAVSHEIPKAMFNCSPVRLSINDDNGQVIAAGPEVAREFEATVINCHPNTLKDKGYLCVHSQPIDPA